MTKAALYQTCNVPWDIRCIWQAEKDYPGEERRADRDKTVVLADASRRINETARHNKRDSWPHHLERSRSFV